MIVFFFGFICFSRPHFPLIFLLSVLSSPVTPTNIFLFFNISCRASLERDVPYIVNTGDQLQLGGSMELGITLVPVPSSSSSSSSSSGAGGAGGGI